MKVILAEKPSVGRDIAKVLGFKKSGDGYIEVVNGDIVTWAIGHLVTLAEPDDYNSSFKKWSLEVLPILPEKYQLKVVKSTEKQFKIVSKLLSSATSVVIATDAGREGELIARWIIRKSGFKGSIKRLWISSLTEESIKKGFNNLMPGEDFESLSQAAEERAIADWIVGMNATRAYTVKTNALLTIGRVQTPTLALCVKREQDIQSFKSQPFWELVATFKKDGQLYEGKYAWDQNGEQKTRFAAIEGGNRIILDIANTDEATVASVQETVENKLQPTFFDLTSLQKLANKKYGLTAAATLQSLQRLYDAKYVTYPRTDSAHVSEDVAVTLPGILEKLRSTKWGEFIPEDIPDLSQNKRYTNAKKVTDHHAIIPTGEVPTDLNANDQLIYDAILSHFISAHLQPGKDAKTKIVTTINNYNFHTNGRVVLEPGWRVVFDLDEESDESDDEVKSLPKLIQGEQVQKTDQNLKEGKTQPPKRYTEATLLSAMETAGKDIEDEEHLQAIKRVGGLGTPATRASIIEGLKNREYITLQKKHVVPTDKGINLISVLGDHPLTSAELTAEWEMLLEKIENNQYESLEFRKGIEQFSREIIQKTRSTEITNDFNTNEDLGQCPLCESSILERKSFYGCSSYKDGCKFTISKKILGKTISVAQIKKILSANQSGLIKGFQGKKGKFDAHLKLEKGKLVFVFPEKRG